MARGKNIGGLSEETKKLFKAIELRDDWKNHDSLLKAMIECYENCHGNKENKSP
jgi:hypothetical protein